MIRSFLALGIVFFQAGAWAHDLSCTLNDLATGQELDSAALSADFSKEEVINVAFVDIYGQVTVTPMASEHIVRSSLRQTDGQAVEKEVTISFSNTLTGYHELEPLYIQDSGSGDAMALKCSFFAD